MKRIIVALTLALSGSLAMAAGEAQPTIADPVVHQRVISLSHELRCLVCQGQSLAESDADFAKDMRAKVQDLVERGMSDAEVKAYLVERYGDFILYEPPFKPETYLLWLGPPLLGIIGITVLVINVRRRRERVIAADAPLSVDEEARVKKLLQEQAGDSKA